MVMVLICVIITIHDYYKIIQYVLVLVEMYSYSYSYSALSNVLVLNHFQCTSTCTLPMKMYSAPGLFYSMSLKGCGIKLEVDRKQR